MSLADLAIEAFYYSTCLDLVTNYELHKEDCTYHPYTYYYGDWLPHLNHKSRRVIYTLFLFLILLGLFFRLCFLILYLQNKKFRIDLVESYIKTISRHKSRAEKDRIILKNYLEGRVISEVKREKDPVYLFRSTNFWCSETFAQLDKLYIIVVVIIVWGAFWCNGVIWPAFMYVTLMSPSLNVPFTLDWFEQLIKYHPEDICPESFSNDIIRQIYSGITICALIDSACLITILVVISMMLVLVPVLWINKIREALITINTELKKRRPKKVRRLELKMRPGFTEIVSAYHDKYVRRKLALGRGLFETLTSYSSEDNSKFTTQHHICKVTLEPFTTDPEVAVSPPVDPVDLLEYQVENEVMALIHYMEDSDEFVCLLSFFATYGVYGLVAVICVCWKSSQLSFDRMLLIALIYISFAIVTVIIVSIAWSNSKPMYLYQETSNIVSFLPVSSDKRKFWDSINSVYFTSEGIGIGYTVLKLYSASWSHLVQLVYWVSTLFFVCYT